MDTSLPSDHPSRQGSRVFVDGLALGDFAVAAPPDPGHPNGVIGALGSSNDPPSDIYVVFIDVATGSERSRVRIGSSDGVTTMIAGAPHGVVVASRREKTIELTWVGEDAVVQSRRSLPAVGGDWRYEMRGFEGFDDRLVIAESGYVPSRRPQSTLTLRVVDDRGRVTASHACAGGLHAPGNATLGRAGNEVVVTNLNDETVTPVCSLQLRGGSGWHETRLPYGELHVRDGALYYDRYDSAQQSTMTRLLGADLRPTGKPIVLPEAPASPMCSDLAGIMWEEATVGGVLVVHTVRCCGDPSPAGLFICRPPGP